MRLSLTCSAFGAEHYRAQWYRQPPTDRADQTPVYLFMICALSADRSRVYVICVAYR